MTDKQWMLNPQAIRHAKECMHIIKDELDIKLTLSHPDFIFLLHEYVEMLESPALGAAYAKLIAMAGPGSILANMPKKHSPNQEHTYTQAVGSDITPHDPNEKITVNGRSFARWNGDKEFHSLYRGQPTYR